MLSRATLLTGLVTLALAAPGAAQEAEPDFDRPGFFLGLGASLLSDRSLEDEVEDDVGSMASVDVDPDFALEGRAGYRVNPYLAGELHFQLLEGFEVGVAGVDSFRVDLWTLTADVRGFLPIGRVHPFLGGGLGIARGEFSGATLVGEDDHLAFAARVGGGVELYVTEHVAVGLEAAYVFPTGNLDELDFISVSLGAQYRF